jgi:hypothetical protein
MVTGPTITCAVAVFVETAFDVAVIVADPLATPVTAPVFASTVATAGADDFHVTPLSSPVPSCCTDAVNVFV